MDLIGSTLRKMGAGVKVEFQVGAVSVVTLELSDLLLVFRRQKFRISAAALI